eukprot:1159645-Pelagomonas_calceolata.AAC.2
MSWSHTAASQGSVRCRLIRPRVSSPAWKWAPEACIVLALATCTHRNARGPAGDARCLCVCHMPVPTSGFCLNVSVNVSVKRASQHPLQFEQSVESTSKQGE